MHPKQYRLNKSFAIILAQARIRFASTSPLRSLDLEMAPKVANKRLNKKTQPTKKGIGKKKAEKKAPKVDNKKPGAKSSSTTIVLAPTSKTLVGTAIDASSEEQKAIAAASKVLSSTYAKGHCKTTLNQWVRSKMKRRQVAERSF